MTSIVMFEPNEWQRHWDNVKDFLKAACDMSGGRQTLESTQQDLADGNYVLLAAIDKGEFKSACVAGKTKYPASNWLTIILCGGEDMADWLVEGRKALDDLAKVNNCIGLEIIGRREWAKVMDMDTRGAWMERRL